MADASRRVASILVGVGLLAALQLGLGTTPAGAAVTCDPGGDVCTVVPDSVQTPLGAVTATVSTAGAVTVHLEPLAANTLVLGVPFSIPPGPSSLAGYARTTIATTGGVISIDTIQIPPGPPARIVLPNVAIVSITPAGPPYRVRTVGTTVTFTPVIPPGPPA